MGKRTTGTISVRGLKQLRTTMTDAGVKLGQLDAAHDRVAGVIVAATNPPRLTGRLKASIRQLPGEGAIVGTDVPYARVQEARYRYLRKGVQKTAPQWTAIYEQEVSDVCDTVKGE